MRLPAGGERDENKREEEQPVQEEPGGLVAGELAEQREVGADGGADTSRQLLEIAPGLSWP